MIIRIAPLLIALLLILPLQVLAQDGAIFSSISSGLLFDKTIWEISEGADEDGIPDSNDSVLINSGHEIEYLGQAKKSLIDDIEVSEGGRFFITATEKQKLWISGRFIINGDFEVRGPHEVIFESSYEHVSGIRVFPTGSFTLVGNLIAEDVVQKVRRPNNNLVVIEVESGSYPRNELIGKKLKLMEGRSRNFVYDIVKNNRNSITIDIGSRGFDPNAGINKSITPTRSFVNEIQVPISLITEKIYAHRSKSNASGQYVGKWIQFVESGNYYFIVGAENGEEFDTLITLTDIAPYDRLSEFRIISGIGPEDPFIIMDYATATIPDVNKGDGVRHALMHVLEADVELKYAEFSYFGSHLGERARYDGWRGLSNGLTFLDIPDLKIEFIDLHHFAANVSVIVKGSDNVHIRRVYTWDVHEKINPDMSLESGHGWVFYDNEELDFDNNVIINMGDDHIYVSQTGSRFIFTKNTAINTPWPRGNSANNLEMILTNVEPEVKVQDNIFLNSDVNVNIQFRNHGSISATGNIIGSTLSRRGANMALAHAAGVVEKNTFLNALQSLAIFGESSIEERNNNHKEQQDTSTNDAIDRIRDAFEELDGEPADQRVPTLALVVGGILVVLFVLVQILMRP
jgi:hypothetical protein